MPYELLADEASGEPTTSLGSEVLRHGARTAARVGEQVAGFPGDVLSLVNEYISRPVVGGITGKKNTTLRRIRCFESSSNLAAAQKGNIKQAGEILKPQNKIEQTLDNIVGDATSLFLPGKKQGKLLGGTASALTKAIGANTAKDITQDWTADEKKGAYAHLGALTLMSFFDKQGAAKAISDGYRPLEARAAQLSPVSSTKLETNLGNLKSKMQKGTQAPSEKFIIDEVDAVLSKVKNGTITPEEAWASKRSLNEKLSKVLFDIPQKGAQQRARKLATQITHELDDALKLTAKQDPKFYKELKSWNAAYGAMAQSNLASRWIENNLKYNPTTAGLIHLFGGSAMKIAGPALAPYEMGKIIYRMGKSDKLRSHYLKTLSSATKEDALSFNKQLKILDKDLQSDSKNDRFTLVED